MEERVKEPYIRLSRDEFNSELYINVSDLLRWIEDDIEALEHYDAEGESLIMTPTEVLEDQLLRLRLSIANREE